MKINSIIKKIIKDYEYRGYLFSYISLMITFIFLIYNFYLGIKYNLVWNISVTFYYLVLILIRLIILICEKKWKQIDKDILIDKRITLFKIENIFLIFIDISLIVPIILMVLQKRIVNVGMIPAIAIAAFTTFKITTSIINYYKTKNMDNIILHGLKIINLKSSIVSVLTLQNILIMTFSNGKSMFTLATYTSIGMLLVLISISIYQIIWIIKCYK